MHFLTVKPGDKLISSYHSALAAFDHHGITHEQAVRSAFQSVLTGYSKKLDWTLVPEYRIQRPKFNDIIVDGALLDVWKSKMGFWEAKDIHDKLEREIQAKFDKGYPKTNILFQTPAQAILVQNGVRQGFNEDISDSKNLAALLNHFFQYSPPGRAEWESAALDFKTEIPKLAGVVKELIAKEHKANSAFRASFEAFYDLCRKAINPNLSADAVEKMLVQHLLTERIFRRVFGNEEFRTRNVIAAEIEKVITSMTSHHFSRDSFLSGLDRFYKQLERAAEEKTNYTEKQDFLNTVYERFFQGFSPKEADTHGIVYTPQPIVDFMVRSVEDILQKEFGKSLADKGVHILDPFVGTGNFITRVMKQIGETRKSALPWKYEHELHCNEIMLLPYYIASMNIEHEYLEQVGEYKPFEGICLVDTFELAETKHPTLFTEENADRVEKQRLSEIFVVVGNPPYNAGQEDENDNNKNRSYPAIDKLIAENYVKASSASLKVKYRDAYIRSIKWATERLPADFGVVALITNNGFVHDNVYDGIRQHLVSDFDSLFILDLGGNTIKNPKLSGTTHNVFGIPRGVSINIFVRNRGRAEIGRGSGVAAVYYSATDAFWTREKKLQFLDEKRSFSAIDWQELNPSDPKDWFATDNDGGFSRNVPIGNKGTKAQPTGQCEAVFAAYSLGVSTNRDGYVYGFNVHQVQSKVTILASQYNSESDRWGRKDRKSGTNIDDFVNPETVKWSHFLKRKLKSKTRGTYDAGVVRPALYRPFVGKLLHFDKIFVDAPARQRQFFPIGLGNIAIYASDKGHRAPFSCLAVNGLADLHVAASEDGFQCFPFYTYDEDGTNRRENITDWALNEFRTHYQDSSITKWEIFYYTYAVLHHPEYRERYAANLKRELPRIPYAPEFKAFAEAGKRLADLHVGYEQQPEFPLERVENPKEKLDWRVEKMRLSKDKSLLTYNRFLTLKGIPPETYAYRLGNRSALEWVVDQYQVSTDKRSGIVNDPNREDDPEYIVRLVGQVITVSLETMKIVKALPGLGLPE